MTSLGQRIKALRVERRLQQRQLAMKAGLTPSMLSQVESGRLTPSLATLDAPDREVCVVRRSRTNTPLQALVLMNDPTYVEASRKLAERMMKEGGLTPADRIAFAFKLATARAPREKEPAVLKRVFEAEHARFAKDKPAAEKLLKVGESPRDTKLDAAELAAWAMVANAILNLDEVVTRN